jgi:hypothetical protein
VCPGDRPRPLPSLSEGDTLTHHGVWWKPIAFQVVALRPGAEVVLRPLGPDHLKRIAAPIQRVLDGLAVGALRREQEPDLSVRMERLLGASLRRVK